MLKKGTGPVSSLPKKIQDMTTSKSSITQKFSSNVGRPKIVTMNKKQKMSSRGGGDDILNMKNLSDVTVLAGVNIEEEERNSLDKRERDEPSDTEMEFVKESEKELDEMFLNTIPLKKLIYHTVIKGAEFNGEIEKVDNEAVRYLSEAAFEKLKDITESLVLVSQHRSEDFQKAPFRNKFTQDTRRQLKLLAKIEEGRAKTSGHAPGENDSKTLKVSFC